MDDEDPKGRKVIKDPEIVAYLQSLPEGRLELGKVPPRIAQKMFGDEMQGVRCPKCSWKPRAGMSWLCSCRRTWNTFSTHGICPSCQKQWKDTQCSACHEWSPHIAWHFSEGIPN